jgi:hypothetical protein
MAVRCPSRYAIAIWLVAILSPGTCASAQSEANAVDAILRIVPAEAHAALIVPNLKRLSDDLTRLLEGMDRANVLLGSRPIDQFKSITGFTSSLNDNGSAAMIVLDAAARPPRIAWVLPVTDAQQFLDSNFSEHNIEGQADAHRRGVGTTYYAKTLASHVVLSEDAAAARSFACDEGLAESVTAAMGDRASLSTSGELLIVLRQPAIGAMKQALLGIARDFDVALPGAAIIAQELADDAETIVLVVDCDPLALIVRGVARFRSDADFGKLARGAEADAGLARLPNKPFALALSVNLAAMGGEGMLRGVAEAMGDDPGALPPWLAKTNTLQFAVAPSPAGRAGGLLNEAMLVLAGDEPATVRDAIKRDVLAAQHNPNIQREAKWKENQPLPDGHGHAATADAWEIRTLDAPPELAHVAALENMLFGTSGMRGYVRQEGDAVLMTFSQRPAVLAALSESVRQSAGAADATRAPTNASGKATGFGGNAAVRIIRQWLPAQRDIEVYVHAGPMGDMIAAALASFPGAAERLTAVPEFGAGFPPIGAAIDVAPQRAEGALVVPRDVLAPVFDELMRRRPAPQAQPVEPSQ